MRLKDPIMINVHWISSQEPGRNESRTVFARSKSSLPLLVYVSIGQDWQQLENANGMDGRRLKGVRPMWAT